MYETVLNTITRMPTILYREKDLYEEYQRSPVT